MIQSLFYIRFLKPPPVKCAFHQPFNIVWTVESDLGDRPFGGPFTLACETNVPDVMIQFLPVDKKPSRKRNNNDILKKDDSSSLTNFDYEPFRGSGGIVTRIALVPTSSKADVKKVQLSFSLAPEFRTQTVLAKEQSSADIIPHPVWHEAYPLIRSSAYQDGTSYSTDNVWIIPTWSMPINIASSSPKQKTNQQSKEPPGGQQAQRCVKIESNQVIFLCEDVEQSIARHVWDCGLVMCDFIKKYSNEIKCNHVIELGSGTGLVGIVAALILRPKTMVLTDLPDALEIMQKNVDSIPPVKTDIQAKVLSWGPKESIGDGDEAVWTGDEKLVDLVLLTDVLYNQGSHDLLLETLDWLMVNPKCRVLLSYKERNPDERAFFAKVKERQWRCDLVNQTMDYPFEMYWILK